MYRKFWKPLGLIILMVLICLLPAAVLAAPIAKISHLEGEVDITAPGAKTVIVKLADPVSVGDILRTKAKSKVEVTFLDGNVIFIAERSRLRISEYDNREDKKSTLDLFRGKTRVVVNNIARKSAMELRTPTAVAGVRGTIWIGSFLNGVSSFTFERGEGYGYNKNMPDKIVTIRAGQTMEVTAPDRLPVVRPTPVNELNRNQLDTTASRIEQQTQETAPPAPGEYPGAPPDVPPPPLPPLPPPPEPTPILPPTPPPPDPTPIGGDLQTSVTGLAGFTGTFNGSSTGGLISLAGTFASGTAAGTTGISGTGFAGYLAGIPGSWEGLYDSLYREGDTVSFLTGSLSDPAFTGTTLNATGTLTRTGAYAVPTAGQYTPFADGPMLLFRNISNVPDVTDQFGLVSGYRTTAGGLVAVGSAATTGGSYTYIGPTWTWQYGGYRQQPSSRFYAFLGEIIGTDDGAGHITLESATPGRFMDSAYLGTVSLRYRGVYTGAYPYISYDSVGTAQYDLQPLAFNGQVAGTSGFWYLDRSDIYNIQMRLDPSSSISGLVGGTQTLFGAIGADGLYPAVPVYGLGTYNNPYDSRPLFLVQVEGNDPTTLASPNYTIIMGGVAGIAGATTLSGGMQGLYWKPGSSAGTYELGLLTSSSGNPGSLYPNLATKMWKLADGTQIQAYRLYDNLASLSDPTISTSTSVLTNLTTSALDIEGWSGPWVHEARDERKLTFMLNTAQPWSLWSTVAGGTYAAGNPPPIGANWRQFENIDDITPGPPYVGQLHWKTAITDVQSNIFEAQLAAVTIHWGNDSTDPGAWTSVGGAQATGMFNPATSTWQAVSLWTGIETAAFMNKVSAMTDDQRTAFYKATNIPAFNVGATDLRGSGSATDLIISNLAILNATFFAPTSGAKPQIWASGGAGGGVTGTYTGGPGDPSGTPSFTLTGYQPGTTTPNSIWATFAVQKWSGTTWGATITTGAAPANSLTGAQGFTAGNAITFEGGAAGTITSIPTTSPLPPYTVTPGNFSGTAAGIVR